MTELGIGFRDPVPALWLGLAPKNPLPGTVPSERGGARAGLRVWGVAERAGLWFCGAWAAGDWPRDV